MDHKELIRDAYDLHVHSTPDVLPGKMDDIEMAQRIKGSGMAGYAIRNHYLCTSERAELINKLHPDYDAVGTITLSSSIGGINPMAMEMAARSGTRLVWFPTCDSAHEIAYMSDGSPNKKLPYWAQIIMQMKEVRIQAPVIRILEEGGTLEKPVMDMLDVIAKHDMMLATGHVPREKASALVEEAKDRGVRKIVVTHVDFPTTYYTVEEQKRFVEMGAVMEHCYTTWVTGRMELEVTKEMVREIGPVNCVLATDSGQKAALYPDEGLLGFAKHLYGDGFTAEKIRTMTMNNPRALLGK